MRSDPPEPKRADFGLPVNALLGERSVACWLGGKTIESGPAVGDSPDALRGKGGRRSAEPSAGWGWNAGALGVPPRVGMVDEVTET